MVIYNRISNDEVLRYLGLNNLTEVTKLDKETFYEKIKVAKKNVVNFYNKAIKEKPEQKKVMKRVKKSWTKALNKFKKENVPSRLKRMLMLKEMETRKVNLFFELRQDRDCSKKVLNKGLTDKQILKICEKLAHKYDLDDNDSFLKQNELTPKEYSKKYFYAICSWINQYVELLYSSTNFESEPLEYMFLENQMFLETEDERKEDRKSKFIRRVNNTTDILISGILVVAAASFYILGGVISLEWLSNILFSIASSILAAFLIDLINKVKHIYFENRFRKINWMISKINKIKSNVENDYNLFKNSGDKMDDFATAFYNYCSEIKELLNLIKNVKKTACLDWDPFTINYKALTKYYETNIDLICHDFVDDSRMQEEEQAEKLAKFFDQCVIIVEKTYGVVQDLIDGVISGLSDNFPQKQLCNK